MARLPQPGSDKGTWGQILNEFLAQSHNSDGSLKTGTIVEGSIADGAVSEAKLDAGVQAKLNATTSVTGKANDADVVHNTGNETVTGTKTFSASPVIPAPSSASHATTKNYVDTLVSGVSSGTIADGSVTQAKLSAANPTSGQVLSSDGSSLVWATPASGGSGGTVADASTTVKGVVQLAGDLAGTAAAPTVPGLASKVNSNDARLTDQRTPSNASVTPAKLDSVAAPTNGQILAYNGTKFNWVAAPTGGSDPVLGGELSGTASNASIVANAVTTAKVAADAITEPKLAISNSPASNQVLSWNGSAMAWATPASGGGGGGSAYTGAEEKKVYSDAPPAGLNAIAADGTTDDSANIQAHLNYVKATWGAGTVKLPPKTIKMMSGLTIPTNVTLSGVTRAATILDFSGAGGSVVAVAGSHPAGKPLDSLRLKGPNGGNKMTYPTNTSTGISFSGVNVTVTDVAIDGFFYGIDLTNPDTFFFCGNNLTIGNAGVGIDMNQSAAHNGGTVPSENGERMRLVNSVVYNSQLGFDARGSGVGFFADGCSFDYLGKHGFVSDAFVFLTNCHLETGFAPTNNNNWGSTERYMIDMELSGRLTLNACRLEVRDAGVYSAITPFNGPSSYNSGFVRFNDCTWYGNIPTGGARQYNSRDMLYFPSGSSATLVTYSPFATKWNGISAYQVSTDASVMSVGYEMYITAADVSSVAGGTPTQAVTITRRPPAGETTHPQMWIIVQY